MSNKLCKLYRGYEIIEMLYNKSIKDNTYLYQYIDGQFYNDLDSLYIIQENTVFSVIKQGENIIKNKEVNNSLFTDSGFAFEILEYNPFINIEENNKNDGKIIIQNKTNWVDSRPLLDMVEKGLKEKKDKENLLNAVTSLVSSKEFIDFRNAFLGKTMQ